MKLLLKLLATSMGVCSHIKIAKYNSMALRIQFDENVM